MNRLKVSPKKGKKYFQNNSNKVSISDPLRNGTVKFDCI